MEVVSEQGRAVLRSEFFFVSPSLRTEEISTGDSRPGSEAYHARDGRCKPHLLSHAHFLNTSLVRLFVSVFSFLVCMVSFLFVHRTRTHPCSAWLKHKVSARIVISLSRSQRRVILLVYSSFTGTSSPNLPTPTTPLTTTSLRPSTLPPELYLSQKRGMSTPNERRGVRFLADSTHSTGYEPKMQLYKPFSEDSDKTPINDPNHKNLSDFSRVTRQDTE